MRLIDRILIATGLLALALLALLLRPEPVERYGYRPDP